MLHCSQTRSMRLKFNKVKFNSIRDRRFLYKIEVHRRCFYPRPLYHFIRLIFNSIILKHYRPFRSLLVKNTMKFLLKVRKFQEKKTIDLRFFAIDPFVFTLMNSMNVFKTVEQPSNDDDESEPNDDETDSSFPAIVNLPLVEVKTGEEDEEILFCERAKLYRFDSTSNQMKERGVGPMKILQHRTSGICRILMRRDEIFKICANHQISPEIKLDKHQGKDTTFIWSAVDFSDGKENGEVFCVRFKTVEQAQAFNEQFNRAQKINRERLNVSKSDDDGEKSFV